MRRRFDIQNVPEGRFPCASCRRMVEPLTIGGKHRNHCPYCLSSIHADDIPGDRNSQCDGVMEPISVWVRRDGEWAIIHRCKECGVLHSNRIAEDDNPAKLLELAAKPLANPPFPLEHLDRMMAAMQEQNQG